MRLGFQKWKEKTSTSPSGRRLGIYKSLANPDRQEEEKATLLDIITKIVNIALKNGITLKRWCSVHNIMLEKDPIRPQSAQAENYPHYRSQL